MASKHLKRLNSVNSTQMQTLLSTAQRIRKQIKGGSLQEIGEITDEYLDEVLQNNNL